MFSRVVARLVEEGKCGNGGGCSHLRRACGNMGIVYAKLLYMHGDAHTSFLLKNSAISHVQCVVGNLANLKIQIIPGVSELFIRELNI